MPQHVLFVNFLEVDDMYIEDQLSEGLTPEQLQYVKEHKDKLNEGIKDHILQEYYMTVLHKEVDYLLKEAGLL